MLRTAPSFARTAYKCPRLGTRFGGANRAGSGLDGVSRPAPEKLDAAESHHSGTQRCSNCATVPILHLIPCSFRGVRCIRVKVCLSNEMRMSGQRTGFDFERGHQWIPIFSVFFCAPRLASIQHNQVSHSYNDVGKTRTNCWKPSISRGPKWFD